MKAAYPVLEKQQAIRYLRALIEKLSVDDTITGITVISVTLHLTNEEANALSTLLIQAENTLLDEPTPFFTSKEIKSVKRVAERLANLLPAQQEVAA